MQFSTVNETLLIQAAEVAVGHDATEEIIKLYQMLDKAMRDGYDLGKHEAEQDLEAKVDEAWDNGYDKGVSEAAGAKWDEGYLDGVRDARNAPQMADAMVRDIISRDEPNYDLSDTY